MESIMDERRSRDNSNSSSFRESEIVVNKLLPLLEKIKVAPSPSLMSESRKEIKAAQDLLSKSVDGIDDVHFQKLLSRTMLYMKCCYQSTQTCKELSSLILSLILSVGDYDDIREYMRKDLGLFTHLQFMLQKNTTEDERQMLFRIMELYTRDLEKNWNSGPLQRLIQYILSLVVRYPTENLDLAIMALINVCVRNDSCMLALHRMTDKKAAFTIFLQAVQMENAGDVLTLVLHSHLTFITARYLPNTFVAGFEFSKLLLRQAITMHHNTDKFQKCVQAIKQIVSTYCDSLEDAKSRQMEVDDAVDGVFPAEQRGIVQLMVSSQEELYKFVFENVRNLDEDIKESALLLTRTFLEPYGFFANEPTLVTICTAAAQTARRILTTTSSTKVKLAAHKLMNQASELVFGNPHLTKDDANSFKALLCDFVGSLSFDPDAPLGGTNLVLYSMGFKLYSYLIKDPFIKEKLKTLLNHKAILAMLNKSCLNQNQDNQRLKKKQSTFVVQLLYVTKHLPGVDLTSVLTQSAVSNQIAFTVRNGSQQEIARCLRLMSEMPDAAVKSVSRALQDQQEFILAVPNTPDDLLPHNNSLSNPQQMAQLRMNFQNEPMDEGQQDLIDFYELQYQALQREVEMKDIHIIHLYKTVNNLRELQTKQTRIFTRQIAESEKKSFEFEKLQSKYSATLKKSNEEKAEQQEVNRKFEKKIHNLEEALGAARKTISKINEDVQKLQAENSELLIIIEAKDDNEQKLQNELAGLKKQLNSLRKEHDDALIKIEDLKVSINIKSKEAEEMRESLDQKQKIIENIQNMLGNGFRIS